MTEAAKHTPGPKRKVKALIKPNDITLDEWLITLRSLRSDLMRQLRSSVHSRGMDGGICRHIDCIDFTIAQAESRS